MKVHLARSGLGTPGAVLGSVAILSLAAVSITYLLVYAPSASRTVISTTTIATTTTATSTLTVVETVSTTPIPTANIAVTSASMKSSGTSSVGSITLSNTGTASAYASAVSLTYQGTSCTLPSADVTGGGSTNPIIGGATQTLTISLATAGQYCGTTTAISGNAYNGYVILSNGAQASFTGNFL